MDLVYLILLMVALIVLCLGNRRTAKTLVFITFVSFMTLVIRDYEPVWAYIIGLVRSGFKAYHASVWVLHNFCVVVSMALSLFFTNRKNRNPGIIFISLTIILMLLEHWNTIISLFV